MLSVYVFVLTFGTVTVTFNEGVPVPIVIVPAPAIIAPGFLAVAEIVTLFASSGTLTVYDIWYILNAGDIALPETEIDCNS